MPTVYRIEDLYQRGPFSCSTLAFQHRKYNITLQYKLPAPSDEFYKWVKEYRRESVLFGTLALDTLWEWFQPSAAFTVDAALHDAGFGLSVYEASETLAMPKQVAFNVETAKLVQRFGRPIQHSTHTAPAHPHTKPQP